MLDYFLLFSNEKGGPAPPVVIPSYLSYAAVKRKNNFIIKIFNLIIMF